MVQSDQGLKLRGPDGREESPVTLHNFLVWLLGASCWEKLGPWQEYFIMGGLTGMNAAQVLWQESGQWLATNVHVFVPCCKVGTLASQGTAQVVQQVIG